MIGHHWNKMSMSFWQKKKQIPLLESRIRTSDDPNRLAWKECTSPTCRLPPFCQGCHTNSTAAATFKRNLCECETNCAYNCSQIMGVRIMIIFSLKAISFTNGKRSILDFLDNVLCRSLLAKHPQLQKLLKKWPTFWHLRAHHQLHRFGPALDDLKLENHLRLSSCLCGNIGLILCTHTHTYTIAYICVRVGM